MKINKYARNCILYINVHKVCTVQHTMICFSTNRHTLGLIQQIINNLCQILLKNLIYFKWHDYVITCEVYKVINTSKWLGLFK